MTLIDKLSKKLAEIMGLKPPDVVLLLWLYTNPYNTTRRYRNSIRNIMKHCEFVKGLNGTPAVDDDTLDKLIDSALYRLVKRGLVRVFGLGRRVIRAELTLEGINFIERNLTNEERKVLKEYGYLP